MGVGSFPKRCAFLNTYVDTVDWPKLQDIIERAIEERRSITVLHHNLHSLYLLRSIPELREAYNAADFVYADGMGVVLVARLLGQPVSRHHRMTCVDYLIPLLRTASRLDWRVFFLGATPESLRRGLQRIRDDVPGLSLDGYHGHFDSSQENPSVLERINATESDLLLVGMGMPRQELWLTKWRSGINSRVVISVGGCLDYSSGVTRTPPRWASRMGFEWLSRLIAEPGRLWKRYLVEPWVVLSDVLRARLRSRS